MWMRQCSSARGEHPEHAETGSETLGSRETKALPKITLKRNAALEAAHALEGRIHEHSHDDVVKCQSTSLTLVQKTGHIWSATAPTQSLHFPLFPSQLTIHSRVFHASLLRSVLQLSLGCNPVLPAPSHPSATKYFLKASTPCSENLQTNRRSRVTQVQPVPGTQTNCAEDDFSGGPGKL